jgi:hypothetical protein
LIEKHLARFENKTNLAKQPFSAQQDEGDSDLQVVLFFIIILCGISLLEIKCEARERDYSSSRDMAFLPLPITTSLLETSKKKKPKTI